VGSAAPAAAAGEIHARSRLASCRIDLRQQITCGSHATVKRFPSPHSAFHRANEYERSTKRIR
jgi:hypothetical protein